MGVKILEVGKLETLVEKSFLCFNYWHCFSVFLCKEIRTYGSGIKYELKSKV